MSRSSNNQEQLSQPSGGGSLSWICRTCGLLCEGDAQGAACPYCGDEAVEPLAPARTGYMPLQDRDSRIRPGHAGEARRS